MAHIIGFKVKTISDVRRNRVLVGLVELMNVALGGVDELVLTFQNEEVVGYNTEKKTTYTCKWEPLDELPSLATFGIKTVQQTLFDDDLSIEEFRQILREALRPLKPQPAMVPASPSTFDESDPLPIAPDSAALFNDQLRAAVPAAFDDDQADDQDGASTAEPVDCPKDDPDCLGGAGDCHDACESPSGQADTEPDDLAPFRRAIDAITTPPSIHDLEAEYREDGEGDEDGEDAHIS